MASTAVGSQPAGASASAASAASAASSATCAQAPAYKKAATKFGVSLTTGGLSLSAALAKQEARFGHLPVVRIFDSSVPPSNAWSRRTPVLGSRSVVTSFRMPPKDVLAGKYDSQLKQFFSTAPTTAPIFWSYYHEPEPKIANGSFTAAQYKDAFRHIVKVAASYCRSNLYPTLILTGWTTEPGSKRNWQDYYPGASYISVVAWDPYNSALGRPTSYVDPSKLYSSVLAASKASGKPWGIAETGSMKVAGDTGAGRAAWLKKVGSYFSSNGAAFVTYFQSTSNGDFELRDTASMSAWKTWVQN